MTGRRPSGGRLRFGQVLVDRSILPVATVFRASNLDSMRCSSRSICCPWTSVRLATGIGVGSILGRRALGGGARTAVRMREPSLAISMDFPDAARASGGVGSGLAPRTTPAYSSAIPHDGHELGAVDFSVDLLGQHYAYCAIERCCPVLWSLDWRRVLDEDSDVALRPFHHA